MLITDVACDEAAVLAADFAEVIEELELDVVVSSTAAPVILK